MKMKKLALACGVVMLGVSAQSFAEVSMNIGATSNYLWRGLTQTSDSAAISGGVDWSGASGLYAGAWVSNADWADDMTYELDLYGGIAGELAEFGYDAGVIFYKYDNEADADFTELALSGSWKFLSAGLNYMVSADDDDFEGSLYYYAGVSFDLPQDFSIGGTLGHYNFDPDEADDYTHYQIDLSKSAGDYGDVTLTFSDTDLDEDDYGSDADTRFVVSWSKSF